MIHELQQKRAGLIAKMRALPLDQEAEFNALKREVEAIDREAHLRQSAGHVVDPLLGRSFEPHDLAPTATSRILRSTDKLTDRITLPDGIKPADVSFDRWLRASLSGNWKEAEAELALQRSIVVGSSPGSLLVPQILSSTVLDLVREQSVCVRAGARTLPLQSGNQGFARLDADPASAWLAESAAASFTDPDFSVVQFLPKVLACYTKISIEAWEDGVELSDIISRSIAGSIAAELDKGCLIGNGQDPEILGVSGQPGVLQQDGNSEGIAVFGTFSTAVHALRAAGVTRPLQAIYHPVLDVAIDTATDLQGQPLRPPQSFEKLTRFATPKIPVASGSPDLTALIVGDFTQMIIGMRTELKIELSREAAVSGGDSAFMQRQVWVRAYIRADVGLSRPHFHYTYDIDPLWVPAESV